MSRQRAEILPDAANAVGAVSVYVGLGITKDDKVFAATELGAIATNPKVDAITKDMVEV